MAPPTSRSAEVGRFQTTVWETITAAREGERQAQNEFVTRYRPALVSYLRLKGAPEPEDLAQEVFLRVFANHLLERVDPTRGRFRSYLLAVTRNVLSEQQRRDHALKRGGDHTRVLLSDAVAVSEDPSFDACWCRDLLQRALEVLRAEHPRQHRVLELRLLEDLPYAEVAERLEKPVEHVRVDVHRARQRLVRVIRAEIESYCTSEEEVEEELALFRGALDRESR